MVGNPGDRKDHRTVVALPHILDDLTELTLSNFHFQPSGLDPSIVS